MKHLLAFFVFSFALFSQAQTLQIATGSAKGTYAAMFKELTNACGNEVAMVEVPSDGSMDNINRLVGNQVNGAFVQSDVLYLRARTEELGNVKTLLSLHNEPVHIVALANSGLKEGGTLGIGAKEVVFDSLASLDGRRVGASGGSYVTAQVIRLQSEVRFSAVSYDTNDLALKALVDRQVEAVILVGGAPLGSVTALNSNYKLLPIPANLVERLKGVYRPARLNYPKLNAAGVTTVATDALFVTREYKTQKMIDSLGKFRSCALSKVEELKETTGTHPAWQAVDVNNKGKWAWYDLPAKK